MLSMGFAALCPSYRLICCDIDPSGKTLAKCNRSGDRGVDASVMASSNSSELTYEV
jgi:hypothetical protein